MRSRAGAGGARGPLGMGPRGPWSPSSRSSSSNSTGVGCGSYSSLQRKRRREIVKRERTGYENINIHNSEHRERTSSQEARKKNRPLNRYKRKEQRHHSLKELKNKTK